MAEVEFYGETFHVADEVNEFALMEYAAAAEDSELSTLSGQMAALAAEFRLVQESIAADPKAEDSTPDSEWQRFRVVARKNRATAQALMPVVFAVFTGVTDRPTGLPSDSSDGQEVTPLRSASTPLDQALARQSGRPDMQNAILVSVPRSA